PPAAVPAAPAAGRACRARRSGVAAPSAAPGRRWDVRRRGGGLAESGRSAGGWLSPGRAARRRLDPAALSGAGWGAPWYADCQPAGGVSIRLGSSIGRLGSIGSRAADSVSPADGRASDRSDATGSSPSRDPAGGTGSSPAERPGTGRRPVGSSPSSAPSDIHPHRPAPATLIAAAGADPHRRDRAPVGSPVSPWTPRAPGGCHSVPSDERALRDVVTRRRHPDVDNRCAN
ncbi:MAG: hypothetical protein QOD04_846, partial [Pseudonocardiales bacterium]|nr:hypothetical protein [Pseudonocardiales bacterium]